MVQTARFDVVLMDIMMPHMDGLEATAAIRALTSSAADVPIIALTANSMSGDRERSVVAGMNGYVSKPIERRHLIESIEHATGMTMWQPLTQERRRVPEPVASETASEEIDNFIASLNL